jgi:hypothetical protein
MEESFLQSLMRPRTAFENRMFFADFFEQNREIKRKNFKALDEAFNELLKTTVYRDRSKPASLEHNPVYIEIRQFKTAGKPRPVKHKTAIVKQINHEVKLFKTSHQTD